MRNLVPRTVAPEQTASAQSLDRRQGLSSAIPIANYVQPPFSFDLAELPVYGAQGKPQAKQRIAAPAGDCEQEADCTADRVIRIPEVPDFRNRYSPVAGSRKNRIETCNAENATVPSVVPDVLRSPGQSLGSSIRSFFESHFGCGLGDVRVHTDSKAAKSAAAVNALAYTVGQNVVFGAGQFSPEGTRGRWLLAHELAHVIQQRSLPSGGTHLIQRQTASRFNPWVFDDEGPAYIRRLAARRRDGFGYGLRLAEAAVSVALLNDEMSHPSDFDFIPAERRPFLARSANGQWRVNFPPVTVADESEAQAFVEGVNEGLERHASEERFFGYIAQALQLASLAMTISSLGRQSVSTLAVRPGARPRLVYSGPGPQLRSAGAPVTGGAVAPPVGRRGSALATAAAPATAMRPVESPRRLTLASSQPQPAPTQAPVPQFFPPPVLPAIPSAVQPVSAPQPFVAFDASVTASDASTLQDAGTARDAGRDADSGDRCRQSTRIRTTDLPPYYIPPVGYASEAAAKQAVRREAGIGTDRRGNPLPVQWNEQSTFKGPCCNPSVRGSGRPGGIDESPLPMSQCDNVRYDFGTHFTMRVAGRARGPSIICCPACDDRRPQPSFADVVRCTIDRGHP